MKDVLLIIGHHRSGTSALSGSLRIFGTSLGKNPGIKPDWSNPKGHFETGWGSRLHERILNAIGSSWHTIKPARKGWHKTKKIKPLREELKENIQMDLKADSSPLYVIKDPRINILLPLYLDVFKEINVKPKFIYSQRPHQEIIDSIKRRNKFTADKTQKMINAYNEEANKHLSGYPVVWSSTMDCLSYKPLNYFRYLKKELDLPLKITPTTIREVNNFLDLKLRHFEERVGRKLYKVDFNHENIDQLDAKITKERDHDSGKFRNIILEVNMPKNKSKKRQVLSYLNNIDGTPTRNGLIKVVYISTIKAAIGSILKKIS